MRGGLSALAVMLLAGCAGHMERAANVTGNEVSVTVSNVWNANQAFPLADKHCHQYGKAARQTIAKEYSFSFDCVAI